MAATRPKAVASSASAMPGATTARLVVCDSEIPMKAFMMPQTVPNRPTKGAVAPMVARIPVPREICLVMAASTRSSRNATRSLKPSSTMPADSSASRAVESICCAMASRLPSQASTASARLPPCSSILIRRSARLRATHSSIVLASQIVQVTSEAKASPTMTAFTTMSAWRNMPHGDRLRGSKESGTCATAGSEWTARRMRPPGTSWSHNRPQRFFPLCFISFLLFSIAPLPLIPCIHEAARAKQPLKQSLKVIVHAGFDLIDCGLGGHAVAERIHEAQGFVAKAEMVVLELGRPVRAQHVFEATAGDPSGPRRVGQGENVEPAIHLHAIVGLHPCGATLRVEHQRSHDVADPAAQAVVPVVVASDRQRRGARGINEIGPALRRRPAQFAFEAGQPVRRKQIIVTGLQTAEHAARIGRPPADRREHVLPST